MLVTNKCRRGRRGGLAGLTLVLMLGACGERAPAVDSQARVTDASPTPTQESGSTKCDPASFRPPYLPWLDKDEDPPPPDRERDGRNMVLTWSDRSNDDVYVALVTHYDNAVPVAGTDFDADNPPPSVRVRGSEGYLMWIGDPGVGELAILWAEGRDPCGSYSLHLLDRRMSEDTAESELRKVAKSLQSG